MIKIIKWCFTCQEQYLVICIPSTALIEDPIHTHTHIKQSKCFRMVSANHLVTGQGSQEHLHWYCLIGLTIYSEYIYICIFFNHELIFFIFSRPFCFQLSFDTLYLSMVIKHKVSLRFLRSFLEPVIVGLLLWKWKRGVKKKKEFSFFVFLFDVGFCFRSFQCVNVVLERKKPRQACYNEP